MQILVVLAALATLASAQPNPTDPLTWQHYVQSELEILGDGTVHPALNHAFVTKDADYLVPFVSGVNNITAALDYGTQLLLVEVHDFEGAFVVCATVPDANTVVADVFGRERDEHFACRYVGNGRKAHWSHMLTMVTTWLSKHHTVPLILHIDLVMSDASERVFWERTSGVLGGLAVHRDSTKGANQTLPTPSEMMAAGHAVIVIADESDYEPSETIVWSASRSALKKGRKDQMTVKKFEAEQGCDNVKGKVVHEDVVDVHVCRNCPDEWRSGKYYDGKRAVGMFTDIDIRRVIKCNALPLNAVFGRWRAQAHAWLIFTDTPPSLCSGNAKQDLILNYDGSLTVAHGTDIPLVCYVSSTNNWTIGGSGDCFPRSPSEKEELLTLMRENEHTALRISLDLPGQSSAWCTKKRDAVPRDTLLTTVPGYDMVAWKAPVVPTATPNPTHSGAPPLPSTTVVPSPVYVTITPTADPNAPSSNRTVAETARGLVKGSPMTAYILITAGALVFAAIFIAFYYARRRRNKRKERMRGGNRYGDVDTEMAPMVGQE